MQETNRNANRPRHAARTDGKRWLLPALCGAVAAVILVATLFFTGVIGGYRGTTLAELKKDGVLKVVILEDSYPYAKINSDGVAVGLEVDILKKVCTELGVTPEFTELPRDKALKGLNKGNYHLVCGGLSASVSTEKPLSFTNPYSNVQQMILCKQDGKYENFASLPTVKLAVKAGTHAEWLAKKQNYNYTAYPFTTNAVNAVESGTMDAMLLDRWTAQAITEGSHSGTSSKVVMMNAAIATAGYCFAVTPDSDEVVNEINVIVSRLAAEGVLEAIFEAHDAIYYSPY